MMRLSSMPAAKGGQEGSGRIRDDIEHNVAGMQ